EGWSIDAAARVAGWQALFAQGGADGPVLLVTSNGAARFAFLADPALGAAMERLGTLKLPTGGYGVIDRDRTGAWRVSGWGLRP
ncbi:histidine phosphatase family protein, partial [Novosphingobium sp. 1949]|nr:histidine phosphatase family protein [Novosphingobium organovorum]